MPESASTPSTSGSSNDSGSIPLAPAVAAVSLKLPPYWPTDPSVWFAQVEAQFITRNITSQSTMFAYVISSLQPEIAQEIRDLLISPPTDEPYNKLKSELIKRTSASELTYLLLFRVGHDVGNYDSPPLPVHRLPCTIIDAHPSISRDIIYPVGSFPSATSCPFNHSLY